MIIRHNAPRQIALARFSGAGSRSLFDAYANAEMRGFNGFGVADGPASGLVAIGKVRLAYGAGGAVLAIVPINWQDLIAKFNPLRMLFTPETLDTPEKAALAKSYSVLGDQIDDWADRKYQWAKAGRRDDGTPYSWAQWADLGQTYLDAIVYQSSLPVTDGFVTNAAIALRESAKAVADIPQPWKWPGWVQAVAVVAVGAYLYNTFRPR